MRITINFPDKLAREAHSRGLAVDHYVEEKLINSGSSVPPRPARRLNREELRASLDSLARYSAEIPSLPAEAFSRESLYEDDD